MDRSFARCVVDGEMLFKHAKGTGAIKGREFHEYHEILLFLDGELEFFSDTVRATPEKNRLIVIPKQKYHQLVIKGNEDEYHRCVFNFYDIDGLEDIIAKAMSRLRIVEASSEVMLLFQKATEIAGGDLGDTEKRILLRSILVLLISEISGDTDHFEKAVSKKQSSISVRCVEYINSHLCEPVTISGLAKEMNISESLLSHSFKKDMGISPYRYMLKKRLILARDRISAGESATVVAIECGFSDYSGFYRQYKKMFGVPPSKSESYFEA